MKNTRVWRRSLARCMGGYAVLLPSLLLADTPVNYLTKDWNIDLSFTQAATYTSDNDLFGDSDDDVSFDFRETSAFFSRDFGYGLEFSSQVQSRSIGEFDDGAPRIDFVYLNYTLFNNFSHNLGVRGGRIKSQFGFYNSSRDVAFSRPSILLPQSIYLDRARDVRFSQDGGEVFGSHTFGLHNFSWSAAVTETNPEDDNVSDVTGIPAIQGELEGDVSYNVGVDYDYNAGQFRFAVFYDVLNFNYNAAPVDFLLSGDTSLENLVVSSQLNLGKTSLTAEYAFLKLDFEDIVLPLSTSDDNFGDSFYVQSAYRFNRAWDAFARFDVILGNREDRDSPQFNSRDFTLGVGWRYRDNFLARVEWHHVEGSAFLSLAENPTLPLATEKEFFDILLLQLSYRWRNR